MLRKIPAEILVADRLIARPAIAAPDPAAFIDQKFKFFLQRIGKRIQPIECLIQTKIGNDIPKILALRLAPEKRKIGEHFCGR